MEWIQAKVNKGNRVSMFDSQSSPIGGGAILICRSLLFVAICVIASTAPFGQPARAQFDSDELSIDDLVLILTENLTSVESLYCEYTVQYGETGQSKNGRYARDGRGWHYAERDELDQGSMRDRIFCTDDELLYDYQVDLNPDGFERWHPTVTLQDPKQFYFDLSPDELLGDHIAMINESLKTILEVHGDKVSKGDALNTGSEYRILALGLPVEGTSMHYDLSLELDPEHGFLPKEILILESETSITWPGWERRWEITEFREVVDEQSGEERWFPVAGVLGQGTTEGPNIRVAVEQVRINPTLPTSLFRPEIPIGATIFDLTTNGKGQSVIKDGHFAVNSNPNGFVGESLIEEDQPYRKWFIYFNLAAIAVVAVLVIRKRRNSYSLHS